jgi:Holliday junction resolvase RusA-like endonuclease
MILNKETFNIAPVPASRPRVTRWGTYYSKRYTQFRKDFAALLDEFDTQLQLGLLSIRLDFFLQIPKSWSKKKKLAKESKYADNNVDIDNLCKAVLDGLEGRYYFNDNQIVMIRARKYYSNNARVEFELLPIEETT